MIAVDTSAIVAILHNELRSQLLAEVLAGVPASFIAAPTLFELRQVMGGRHGPAGIGLADDLLHSLGTETVDWTAQMADLATSAFLRFGKGQGHPAQLNYGDCMAYALAKSLEVPLLFVGEDFARTDITPALAG